jgi:hypothetical protein
MRKAAGEWTDARLDAFAAALDQVPAHVAVIAAAVDRLAEENRVLRAELAATQRQLLQIGWGLVAALVGATAAVITALL